MTNYGTEIDTHVVSDSLTEDIIAKIQDGETIKRWKRTSLRIKVTNKKDETTQYLIWTDMLDHLRKQKRLIERDTELPVRPSFAIDFPKTNYDGSYFVICTHTEIIL
jgi:hypothetical protein